MFNDIDNKGSDEINNLMKDAGCVYKTLMGSHPETVSMETMVNLWIVSDILISRMYDSAIIREM